MNRELNQIGIEFGIRLKLCFCLLSRAFTFVCSRPDRNPVPPPELSADTPVPLFAQPVEVRRAISLGIERHSVVIDGIDRGLSQRVHLHEPLFRQVRLDRCLRTIAMLQRDLAIFHFLEVPELFHLGHHGIACDQSVQPLPCSTVLVQGSVGIQNVDRLAHRFFVASPAGVVVRIVRRGHLHAAGSECFVSQ